MRDNTFTGARGAATVLSRSLRLENATSWVFDLCDDLLLPPRPGVRESVFAHVSYSIAIDGESFTRHKMSEPEGCVVTVRTEEPVSGTVSITVDQSQTPSLVDCI